MTDRPTAATVEALRASALFADLPEDDLERLAGMVESVRLEAGEALLREGEPGDALYVVASGELEVVRGSGTDEVPLALVGPGSVQGEMALLEGRPRNATVRAIEAVQALRLPRAALFELLATRPEAALAMIRTTLGRLRSTEALLGQREKLASLGTLAAGLAHELNNPAAAIRRSVLALGEQLESRTRAADVLAGADSERLARLVEATPTGVAPAGAVERADRIDAMAELLGSLGAGDPHAAAAALVDAGWVPDEVAPILEPYRDDAIEAAIAWIESVTTARALVGEVTMAATRIGDIVRAVKGYAYLDQAPTQRIDVRDGLRDTLVILRHRLRDLSVTESYADDLPEIEAYGGELNQVWTNLVDNAVDALDGRGTIEVSARRGDEGGVVVEICDDGPGIPPDVRPRLFEPFFTTKGPGVGSGLGLHISHQVVARHGGRLEVASQPGRTCFTISLPEVPPRGGTPEGG
ncbi:MAG TPA: ATP-binding protein [Candidatus Limnocylindria bacterium]|nr:ATP-binding protein [Candidatus Limnocylindria bacterium]